MTIRVKPTSAACACLVAAALMLTSDGATAQPVRSGFWLEGTAGTGTVRNTCAGCPGVTVGFGPAYHIRVGGALTRRVLVGLEAFSVSTPDFSPGPGAAPVDAENVSLAPIVIWYAGDSGFFLKAGGGLARGSFVVESEGTEPVTVRRTGSGVTFGVGFDIALTPWLALSANLGTYVTAIGDIRVNETLVDDIIATVYEAGVGITIR